MVGSLTGPSGWNPIFGIRNEFKLKNDMKHAIIAQQPATPARRLLLLFHGVGGTPESMRPVAVRLAFADPTAMVVCVPAPFECDLGAGLQWFSVQGITEENRPTRIKEVLNLFEYEVRRWQNIANVSAENTALVGFSQGGIICLEAAIHLPNLASRIVAHSGRFAQLPDTISPAVLVHWIHGERDEIVGFHHCASAAARLTRIGATFTVDALPSLGHSMSEESMEILVARLKSKH
jgi:phospholipase/carboxylesterase